MSFDKIIPFTLEHEGGAKITHDPNDPGGTTKYGISKHSHPELDIENMTEDQAKEIYLNQYWKPVAKGIDDKLDMVAFDTAVNCGVVSVNNWLAFCKTWQQLIARRREHYALVIKNHPEEIKYAGGWENRIADLERFVS
jgi:hypothetical protein